MVEKTSAVYLFAGQDPSSKDASLNKIKEEISCGNDLHFNLDVLYARELTLKDLQEKLLCLPLKSKKRLVVIKDALNLKADVKEFISRYVKKPYPQAILLLDMDKYPYKDEFIKKISPCVRVLRFKEEAHPDAFVLGRAIDLKKAPYALSVLRQLLKSGEKPERILGGLRFSWENRVKDAAQSRKRLAALLGCDIEIKTGRLKPEFALEKLIINLCCLTKPLR
ncbi:MAG: hypothetical protein PHE18_09040 [Candidatus Omnitrophica bacterium]|nr:hypothetical protein [Candidatus Omnitrophota bacterium]MDD5553997.1 hypothetical protein [Candidatus Omnitrophota bacterium]